MKEFKVIGPKLIDHGGIEHHQFVICPDGWWWGDDINECRNFVFTWLEKEQIPYSYGFSETFSVFNETDATKVKLRFG